MDKKIVIIGANDFQKPLIQKAGEMGYETHVFAWRDGATGARYADHFYDISITEHKKILKECERIKPQAVATIGSDLANITVQYLAEKLGLPGNSRECICCSTNKYAMRQAMKAAGVSVPYFQVTDGKETEKITVPSYPVIVKPTDRSGSRAITRVERHEDLQEAVRNAIDQSFEKKAIIEEYLSGQEYSMEAISYEGTHTCLAVTKKFTTGDPHYIEIGHLQPAPLEPELKEKIIKEIFRALDALKIRNGASHSEFLVDEKGKVHIIEIGSRMGGDCIGSHLVPLSTGQDFVKMVVQTAAGEKPELNCRPLQKCSAIRFIMDQKDLETLKHIEEKYPQNVVEKVLEGQPGTHPVTDSSSRFGFYIFQTDTMEETEQMQLWK